MVLQVANYPSQLIEPGPNNLRKKAHVDSGTLTLLASQDWAPDSGWKAGDGGLQLLNSQGQWVEVEVPQGRVLGLHSCKVLGGGGGGGGGGSAFAAVHHQCQLSGMGV